MYFKTQWAISPHTHPVSKRRCLTFISLTLPKSYLFNPIIKFYKGVRPAVEADGYVIMGLIGTHLIQHLQNGRDGVWYTVIWPVDIVQLFQSSATLESKSIINNQKANFSFIHRGYYLSNDD